MIILSNQVLRRFCSLGEIVNSFGFGKHFYHSTSHWIASHICVDVRCGLSWIWFHVTFKVFASISYVFIQLENTYTWTERDGRKRLGGRWWDRALWGFRMLIFLLHEWKGFRDFMGGNWIIELMEKSLERGNIYSVWQVGVCVIFWSCHTTYGMFPKGTVIELIELVDWTNNIDYFQEFIILFYLMINWVMLLHLKIIPDLSNSS